MKVLIIVEVDCHVVCQFDHSWNTSFLHEQGTTTNQS